MSCAQCPGLARLEGVRAGKAVVLGTRPTLALNSASWPFSAITHRKLYFYGTVAEREAPPNAKIKILRESQGPEGEQPTSLCPVTVEVGKFCPEGALGLRVQRLQMLSCSSGPLDFH